MTETQIIPIEQVGSLIRIVRGQNVMLDEDLARLYEVETRILNRAVRRHLDQFPGDFMFQLTKEEFRVLISQIGISKSQVSNIEIKLEKHDGDLKVVFEAIGLLLGSPKKNSNKLIGFGRKDK